MQFCDVLRVAARRRCARDESERYRAHICPRSTSVYMEFQVQWGLSPGMSDSVGAVRAAFLSLSLFFSAAVLLAVSI